MGGAVFGEVAVSLFVAGAAFGEIWNDSWSDRSRIVNDVSCFGEISAKF